MQTSFPLKNAANTHSFPPLEGRHPKLSSSPGWSNLPHGLVARMTWNTKPPLYCGEGGAGLCTMLWCFMWYLACSKVRSISEDAPLSVVVVPQPCAG